MKRVLIIKMSSLGDLFHALPAVHCIKAGWGASIDWVAHDIYADLVRVFTDVDRCIPFPRGGFLSNARPFLNDLRRDAYDAIIDMQGLLKSAMVLRLARGGARIGPSFSREGACFFYDAVAGKRNKNRHAVEEILDVVRHLELPLLDPVFPVKFPRRALDAPRPRVALLPCSRRPEKNWSPGRFVEVARALREQQGASIFLLGSPADKRVCDDMAAALGEPVHNLCGQTGVVELGSVLQEMDLLVTVDSGPMHMAVAVGTPVVAVFGPTDPVRTGPYGTRHSVIRQGASLADLPSAPVMDAAVTRLRGSK